MGQGSRDAEVNALDKAWLFAPIAAMDRFPEYRQGILARYERHARWAGLAGLVLDRFRPSLGSYRYLFYGCKYLDIMAGLPAGEVAVLGGPKEWPICLRHGFTFYSFCGGYQGVVGRLAGRRNALVAYDRQFRRDLAEVDGACLIVSNDTLPPSRYLVETFRQAAPRGRVVCIQHGIYQTGYRTPLIEGHLSDLNLVYSERQGDIFVRNGVGAETIRVLGFHSDYPRRDTKPARPAVCILSEGWHPYDRTLGDAHYHFIKRLAQELRALGLEVVVRPHPSENRRRCQQEFGPIDTLALKRSLQKYDLFVGTGSTVLIEAGLAGRCGVQVRDPRFSPDNYQAEGYCSTIEAEEADGRRVLEVYQAWEPGSQGQWLMPAAQRFLAAIREG